MAQYLSNELCDVINMGYLDSVSLALICRRQYKDLSRPLMEQHETLRQRFSAAVSDDGAGLIPQGGNATGEALELILRRELPATLIKSLELFDSPYIRRHHEAPHSNPYDWGKSIRDFDGGCALRRVIENRSWIHKDEQEQFYDAVVGGDEGAAFCLLLPVCKSLPLFSPFWLERREDERIYRFVSRMAKYHRPDILPNLEMVWGYPSKGEWGIPL